MRRAVRAMGALWRRIAPALLLLAPTLASAQADPGEALRISLLTFAPGEIYWQRFGHNALLVRDRARGEARVYNYGIFDFQQKNFFVNFARGRMLYRLDTVPLDWTLRQYAAEGRWAVEQQLDLTPAQRRQLAEFLAWNALPENADYRYDYFTANCSTRVRDALDRTLGGELRAQLQREPGSGSYRSEVLRLMAPVPALMLGMDLGLGSRADAPLDQWAEGFVPMRLMHAIRTVRIPGEDGAPRPLVLAERRLIADEAVAPAPAPAPRLLLPFALAGLCAAAGLALLAWQRRRRFAAVPYAVLAAAYALVCGLAGAVLALGWLATEHWGMSANRNLLLFNPLWLLLVPAVWSSARDRRPPLGRYARPIAMALGAAAVVALPLAVLGAQPNLHWVALLLPVHAVVLHRLLSRR